MLLFTSCLRKMCFKVVFLAWKLLKNPNQPNFVSSRRVLWRCPPPPTTVHTQTHTPHTPPHRPQPLLSPLLFPTVSCLLHRALFCFTSTLLFFFFFVSLSLRPQLFCHLSELPLTLKASLDLSCVRFAPFPYPYLTSSQVEAFWWQWNPPRWLYRYLSLANQHFYCNRCAALMWRVLFW